MSKIVFLFLLFCSAVAPLHAQSATAETDTIIKIAYRANVGDIPFDPKTDNPNFEVCNEERALPSNTYCGMLIEGEKYRVLQYFSENYKQQATNGQTGYITIRFLVNCKGETDRFRVYEMDMNERPMHFKNEITADLLALTKGLTGWKAIASKKTVNTSSLSVTATAQHPELYDYYQYITFKLKDGLIETILP